MEKTRYLTAAKPITPGKRYHHQEKENNWGKGKLNMGRGEDLIIWRRARIFTDHEAD